MVSRSSSLSPLQRRNGVLIPIPLQEMGIPAPLVKGKIDPVWKSWKTSSMIYIAKLLDVYLKVFPWYAIFAMLTIIPVEIALQQATGDLKH